MGLFSFLDKMKAKSDADLKARFKHDMLQNVEALIASKGQRGVLIGDLEQEVIYYACDILLHQKAQAGRLPSDPIMTDIIKIAAEVMMEMFPKNYTAQHAEFAQEAVRINLTQAPNMQAIVSAYYNKLHSRY